MLQDFMLQIQILIHLFEKTLVCKNLNKGPDVLKGINIL